MAGRIEDYAFIGNTASCALVGNDGSIDWMCLPRFDSDACFAALLGTPEHGRWLIAPSRHEGDVVRTRRRYLEDTAVLETTIETEDGIVKLTDFMPFPRDPDRVSLVRLVEGVEGRVHMHMELILRFGYGLTVPWVRSREYGIEAVAGPDTVVLVTPAPLRGQNMHTTARFTVEPGQSVPFTLAYHPTIDEPRFVQDTRVRLEDTIATWRAWSKHCVLPENAPEHWQTAVRRSLITLKAMTYQPTGALVAAPTTSLPEAIGGTRNWDYRYCWIRDATLTLYALINSGFFDEADHFRQWLLRAAAGDPGQMQIMYGLGGEHRLLEFELDWLPGYEDSRPVRVGNAAYDQVQLDVYGELMDALHAARRSRLGPYQDAWLFQRKVLETLEERWREPDEGIWEVRGGRQHFTYSKIMCWVAYDRGVRAIEEFDMEGPLEKWRALRDEIHAEVLANGFDKERNTFVQSYGSKALDASLLLIGELGFLPAEDPRYRGTVEAIERELVQDGLVLRYRVEDTDDGLAGEEGTFLICSFWMVDALTLLGRFDDARALFERLLSLCNDVGLLAEEYDTRLERQLGNFPQAFSHVGLVNAAHNLLQRAGPAAQRAAHEDPPQAADGQSTTAALS